MALTLKQKQDWLEALGKPKSWVYFATGPNLGPDWSWEKAVKMGYTPVQYEGFFASTESAYSAHKSKGKATKVPAPAVLPGQGIGANCAKTAAKAVTSVAQEATAFMEGAARHWINAVTSHSKVDVPQPLVDEIDGLLIVSKNFVEALPDPDPVVKALLGFRQFARSVQNRAAVENLSDALIDAEGMDQLLIMTQRWSAARATTPDLPYAKELADALDTTSAFITGEYAANSVRAASMAFDSSEAYVQLLLDNLESSMVGDLEQGFLAWRKLRTELIDSLPTMAADDSAMIPFITGGSSAIDDASMWMKEIAGIFIEPDDSVIPLLAKALGSEISPQILTPAMLIRGATMHEMTAISDWLKKAGSADFWTPETLEVFKIYLGDLDATKIGFRVIEKMKALEDELSEFLMPHQLDGLDEFDDLLKGMYSAFDEAVAGIAPKIPGPASTPAQIDSALDAGFVATVQAAKSDELNALVKANLANLQETPSLTYFMSKQQKIDFLIGDPDAFTAALDASKAKYLAKQGGQAAPPKPKVPAPQPATAADLAKIVDPDVTDLNAASAAPAVEAPGLPKTLAGSGSPDSWGQPHTFTFQGQASHLGGIHRKWFFSDETHSRWMFKNAQQEFRAHGEQAAHEIAFKAGLEVPESQVVRLTVEGKPQLGHIQRLYDGAVDFEDLGISSPLDIAQKLTAAQRAELQQNQILDWLLGDTDVHGGNYMMLPDGRLVRIDRGQSFKFYGSEQLSRTSTMSGNTGHNVYNLLWDAYAHGHADLDLDAVGDTIARIMALSDDDLFEATRSYAFGRWAPGGSKDPFSEIKSAAAFHEALLARRDSLRDDFAKFYRDQIADRGGYTNVPEDLLPSWARLEDAVEEVAEVVPTIMPSGVMTPVDASFAAGLRANGVMGKTVYVAGDEIERGQILFDVVKDVNGNEVLRVNLKLRGSADAAAMQRFRDAGLKGTPGTPVKVPTFTDLPAVTHAQTVEWASSTVSAAKTVNHHISAGDFAPNPAHITKARSVLASMDAILDDAYDAEAELAKVLARAKKAKASVTNEVAQKKAADLAEEVVRREAAAYYKPILESVLEQADAGPAAVKIPIVTVDDAQARFAALQADYTKQILEAAGGPSVAPVAAPAAKALDNVRMEAMSTSYIRPTVAAQPNVTEAVVEGYIPFPGHKGWTQVSARHGDWDLKYRPFHGSHDPYHEGWMELQVPTGGQVTDETVREVLQFLERDLGVSAPLAQTDDIRLTYWKMMLGNLKSTAEATHVPMYRDGIIAAEKALRALPSSATVRQQIDAIKDGFRTTFGDIVDQADDLPIHKRLSSRGVTAGQEFGWGAYERFDSLLYDYGAALGPRRILHGVSDVRGNGFHEGYFKGASGEGVIPRELGQMYGGNHAGGFRKDEVAALGSGGAPGHFSRTRSGGTAGADGYVLHPRAMRELGWYGYDQDRYGRMSHRGSYNYVDPSQYVRRAGSGNELVGRSYATFYDDVMWIQARTETERQSIIRWLRERGVERGYGDRIPLDEYVVVAKAGGFDATAARAYMKRWGIDLNERMRWTPGSAAAPSPRVPAAAPHVPGQPITSRWHPTATKAAQAQFQGPIAQYWKKAFSKGYTTRLMITPTTPGAFTVRVNGALHSVENAVSFAADSVTSLDPYKMQQLGSQIWEMPDGRWAVDLSPFGIELKEVPQWKRNQVLRSFWDGWNDPYVITRQDMADKLMAALS